MTDNHADDIPFHISYSEFPQEQTLHAVLNSPQLDQESIISTRLDDPSFQVLPTTYQTFPILQVALQTPTSNQPTTSLPTTAKAHPPTARETARRNDNPAIASRIRVTRPPNAFLLFNKEMRKQLKEQNPNLKVGEISKMIGDRWKNMQESDKERFKNEAEKLREKQRALHPNSMYMRRSKAELIRAGHYLKQMNSSQDNSTTASSRPRKKTHRRDKHPAAPKHPLSAYMWYLTEARPETMRTYPGSTVGQISKLCAERWNTMTEAERMPWKTKAQADKLRYASEMQIYVAQNNPPLCCGTRQKYRIVRDAHNAE